MLRSLLLFTGALALAASAAAQTAPAQRTTTTTTRTTTKRVGVAPKNLAPTATVTRSKPATAPARKVGDGDGAYAAPGQPIEIQTTKVEPYNATNAPATTTTRRTSTTRQTGK